MKFEPLYNKDGTVAVEFKERTGRFHVNEEPTFSDVRSDVTLARVREMFPDMKLMNAEQLAEFKAQQANLEREVRERAEAEDALRLVEEEAKVLEFAGVVVAGPVSEAAV